MKKHIPNAMMAIMAIGALSLCAAPMGYTRENNHRSVFDMPLEELLNMEVSTASKKSEKTIDAPGIITIISAEEIERFGATNLLDVLERIPGAYVAADNAFPKGNVSIRGDITPEVNNHMLLLLNGRPIRESTHGAMNTAIYTAFPLSAIEKIDVVRGPGSVLYGTNAYSGVINIFTRGKDNTTAGATAGVGSFSTRIVEAAGNYAGDDYYLAGGIRHLKNDNVQEYDDAYQLTGDYNPEEDLIGVTLNGGYKGFTFTSFLGGNKIRRDEHPDVLHSGAILDTRTIALDLGYTHPLASFWDISINATLNDLDNKWETFHEEATDYVFELTNYFSPTDTTNILVGGSVYILTG